MVTVLVTGVAGFIGYHVAQALLARGDRVVGVDNMNNYYSVKLKQDRLAQIQSENFEFIQADISDKAVMNTLFREHQIDKVCHMAAQAGVRYSLTDPYSYEQSNNLGFLTLLEMCKEFKVHDIVFASSSSVYGGREEVPFKETDPNQLPISVYAATKRYNELLAHVYNKLYGLRCTGLRFFTVYGPWGRPDMALYSFVTDILANNQIRVFNNGQQERDFTYIDDIVQGVLTAIDKPFDYEIINLGRGDPVGLMEFVRQIEKALGKEANIRLETAQPGDVARTFADISKARELLGYDPKVSLEEAVKKFVEWYIEYHKSL